MHSQVPLAIEPEKEAVLRELYIILPSFPLDYLDSLLEAVRARRHQLSRPALRIHVAEPEEESAC